jgi:hypothetical protein
MGQKEVTDKSDLDTQIHKDLTLEKDGTVGMVISIMK